MLKSIERRISALGFYTEQQIRKQAAARGIILKDQSRLKNKKTKTAENKFKTIKAARFKDESLRKYAQAAHRQ